LSAPTIGVLALQGDVREHQHALERLGALTQRIRSVDELARVDGLVIPGGESTTIGKLAQDLGVLDGLVELVHSGVPVYGSCAGMILLADDVLDAKVGQRGIGGIQMSVRRNAFGRQVASFEADLIIPAFGSTPFPAVFIRAPWVEHVGQDVEVLASIADETAAGRIVAVRQGNLMATAFHPELTGDDRVHRYFLDLFE
jgi:pyridoxal 5'-phosphate synthase pdxT subunit